MTFNASPTIYAFICGHANIPASFILDGAEGMMRLPVPGYVVVHPEGNLVFDTGFNTRVHHDPDGDYVPEGFYATRDLQFTQDDEMARQMREAGFDPDSVRFVANSHLHYDHAGGNDQFPAATLILQEDEYRTALRQPDDFPGYRKKDFLTGQNKLLVNGVYDVFGDGTVILEPTPGHTPGHQSLRITANGQTTFLTADACYLEATLDSNSVPGIKSDEGQFLASLAAIRAIRDEGAFVVFGHDPELWARLPKAPEPLAPVDMPAPTS
ncbi:N-acyl homoserine lactonase family protein [Rhodococcus koreensis]